MSDCGRHLRTCGNGSKKRPTLNLGTNELRFSIQRTKAYASVARAIGVVLIMR
jgi:hypothetical protein